MGRRAGGPNGSYPRSPISQRPIKLEGPIEELFGERGCGVVILEFSVSPLGAGESVSPYVARCVEIVEQSGLAYQLHAMGTLVEGELDQVLAVLQRCIEAVATDCSRVTCSAKLDYRRGYSGRLVAKVESVEQKLGRKTKHVGE